MRETKRNVGWCSEKAITKERSNMSKEGGKTLTQEGKNDIIQYQDIETSSSQVI